MSQLLGREGAPQVPSASGKQAGLAIAVALVGHVVALIAAATDAIAMNVAITVGLAASVIAIAALAEAAAGKLRARRALAALVGADGLAAAIALSGLAPGVAPALPLAALAAAAALEAAGLAAIRFTTGAERSPTADRAPAPPLAIAPRVAAIALVSQMVLRLWAASASARVSPLRAAGFLALSALGVALLASMATLALRLRRRWVIAGLVAWSVGWLASTADLGALLVWSLGGTFPVGRHQLRILDPELVQIIATLGGLAIGGALVAEIRESRFRHSATILLIGHAVFGLIAAVTEHRIDLATDFPSIVALGKDRDLAGAITDVALAGVLWLYWRRVVAGSVRLDRHPHGGADRVDDGGAGAAGERSRDRR